MAASLTLLALAAVGVAAQDQPNVNTNTSPAAVYAAQATAATYEKASNYVPGRVFDRFVEIWLENTDFEKAASDPNLAAIAKQGVTLTNYFGVTHPSEPNYVSAVGGDNFGMDNDNFNQIPDNVFSVVDLLEARGISWGSYQEHMPYTGYEGFNWVNQETGANDYVRKHNPPVIYNKNTSPQRLSYQKNFTLFHEDVAAQRLPQWSFITPNMTNDGHDTSVTVAGAWAKSFLEPLLQNKYFTDRTLILLTFDENHTYTIGNRVFSILLGGAVPQNLIGTTDSSFYDHYSDIATVEANWGLNTLGRWDVGANVFKLVGDHTGDQIRTWDAVTGSNPSVFLNSSFAGPYNTEFSNGSWPIPNILAVSPNTWRTVLPAIQVEYGAQYTFGGEFSPEMYYNNGVEIPDGQHPPRGYAVNNVNN